MAGMLLFACAVLVLVNLASLALAAVRIAPHGRPEPWVERQPAVSIVIPARGIEAFTDETLARAFALDWYRYELIFCVADETDPVVPAIRAAIEAHPSVEARLLIGDDRISANPKLNNCCKGWQAARHDWVILADSNVLMPADYIECLMGAWRADTGLVCSMPLGTRPAGFWAEVECAFLNGLQARWQYAGEAAGLGFAQGKSMLWYKPLLDTAGGIRALATEIAEDAASTKLVNRLGLHVHLVAAPFEQPLGRRSLEDVWGRQARWARLRRVTFPFFFLPEIFLGAIPALAFALAGAWLLDASLALAALAVLVASWLPELVLVRAKRWHLSRWSLPAMIARDLMLPVIWAQSWLSRPVHWRGNTMTVGTQFSELRDDDGASPQPL